jgi:putative transposase
MAVTRRRPATGLVHHCDQGGEYTSLVFTQRCQPVGIEISRGSRGDCFDNAVIESFHATINKDLLHRRSWPTKTDARTAMFDYIEAFYHRGRLYSTLGILSPEQYQNRTLRHPGASLAASRLASTNKIIFTSTTTREPRS